MSNSLKKSLDLIKARARARALKLRSCVTNMIVLLWPTSASNSANT